MRGLPATCMALGLAGVFLTVAVGPARADRDRGHHGGWHGGHGWHHEHWRRGPVYVPPRYYAPPPVYYAPPPVYYAPPPAYYGPPTATFSFGIR